MSSVSSVSDVAQVIEAALAELELDHERHGDRFVVALPGEKRLKTACWLTSGAHALEIEAFVMRRPDENHERLNWALSRIAGYVGATGALGTTRGERFVALPDQMNPVLTELASRGLFYVDGRPGAAALPMAWGRSIDIVVDEPATSVDIDTKLAQLAKLAREKGSALGLATAVRPVTVNRIAVWAEGLAPDGLTLAPLSALVKPPAVAK